MKKENRDKIVALRHDLHRHPELSMQEQETKNHLITFIKENTHLEVIDRGHWFYIQYIAKRQSEMLPADMKPPIAFRADFDALPILEATESLPYASKNPGVSHKCGHDGHASALAGLALELDANGADRDVYLIFQHAEEIGRGAQECVSLIKEKQISEIYGFHNWSGFPKGAVVLREGVSQCASRGLTITFTGKKSHASIPEQGKNPSAAIAELILYVQNLLQTTTFEQLVLATIVNVEIGTKDFGISAGEGEISFTLRAALQRELDELEQMICNQAEKLASEEGLQLSYTYDDPFPETANDATAIQKVRNAAEKLDFSVVELEEPLRASEDFGYYTKECTGAMFYLGNGEDYPALHTPEYDFKDELLEEAVDLFCELI